MPSLDTLLTDVTVYGARSETSPLNPLTAYARSKVHTEDGLKKLAGDSFQVTCLRFSTACGWSDRLRRPRLMP